MQVEITREIILENEGKICFTIEPSDLLEKSKVYYGVEYSVTSEELNDLNTLRDRAINEAINEFNKYL